MAQGKEEREVGQGRKKGVEERQSSLLYFSPIHSVLPPFLCLFLFIFLFSCLVFGAQAPSSGHFQLIGQYRGQKKTKDRTKKEDRMKEISIIYLPICLSICLSRKQQKERGGNRQQRGGKYILQTTPVKWPPITHARSGDFRRWKRNAPPNVRNY